jgi:hypothetical protein
MYLSAPIYQLKRKAKLISRGEKIPLHQALDRLAKEEGFGSWSLLASKVAQEAPAIKILPRFRDGDLVLIGARPGEGKTMMSLELAVAAMKQGRRAAFFSLEYNDRQVDACLRSLGEDPAAYENLFQFDGSDHIDSSHIVSALSLALSGTLVVIDYLQLLDQKRTSPDLLTQIRQLKSYAVERGLIMLFISQIDRKYDAGVKPFPELRDVRLPNPLDLHLFDKACFLSNGRVRFESVR